MSNGEHEIRTPKGLRIGNRSVVDGKNMLQIKRGGCEDYISADTDRNYNMIDGCVNNVPKKPRVIGGRVSVLDRLHIKQAERARKDNAQVQQQERTRKT